MKYSDEIRKQIIKNEESLNNNACRASDAIRFHKENEDFRTPFAKDIDSIIHTPSYTRYLDKTQVYTNSNNSNISTRMTHVQFVSRASRTIARALNLNEDLCEAISLAHDIGHTPFGHLGEAILNDISIRETGIGFYHNLNSVRTLMDLEKRGEGCNLTLQVLDGIMCHNGEMVNIEYKKMLKTKEQFLEEYNKCLIGKKQTNTLRPMTLEGCIVRISDIIGYIGKDIDDSRRLGLFDVNTIPEHIKENLGTTNSEIMNSIIVDIIEQSYNKDYIKMSDNIFNCIVDLKAFNYKHIYDNANDEINIKRYKDIMEKLYKTYIGAIKNSKTENDIYTLFLNDMKDSYLKNTTDEQKVIDYISGMTDNFIHEQYKKYIELNW